MDYGIWRDESARFDVQNDLFVIKSGRSGCRYKITSMYLKCIRASPESEKKKISEYLKSRYFSKDEVPYIDSTFVEEALKYKIPAVQERLDRGFRVLSHEITALDKWAKVEPDSDLFSALLGATCSSNFKEMIVFLEELENESLIKLSQKTGQSVVVQLTMAGLKHQELNVQDSSNAFVAMWFNEDVNSVYDEAIKPAIIDCGYIPRRIDRADFNGKIDDEIIAEIRKSKFVIADFTSKPNEPRGGVYYEAGFAQGLGLPVIWTARNDMFDFLHFDTRQYNHIGWANAEDLKPKLLNRILATIGAGPHVSESEWV